MSRILEQIDRFQEQLKALEAGPLPPTYASMQQAGLLKPATFRLPVGTLAMLDELYKFGPWDSKQEMVYELFDDVIQEFLNSPGTGEPVRAKFAKVAQSALDEWQASRQEAAA